jgi:hypothetical protein
MRTRGDGNREFPWRHQLLAVVRTSVRADGGASLVSYTCDIRDVIYMKTGRPPNNNEEQADDTPLCVDCVPSSKIPPQWNNHRGNEGRVRIRPHRAEICYLYFGGTFYSPYPLKWSVKHTSVDSTIPSVHNYPRDDYDQL